MVDDHRQEIASMIARWADEEGGGPFFLNELTSAYPNGAAYRLADVIVSNHCEADTAHLWQYDG